MTNHGGVHQQRRLLGAILICAALVSCALVIHLSLDEQTNDLIQSKHALRKSLMRRLRELLISSSSAKGRQLSDSDLRGLVTDARAQRNALAAKERQSDLTALCHDGGPCSAAGSLPVLKYLPASGAWKVVSMGNPDSIWQHLMESAKTRDTNRQQSKSTISDSRLLAKIAEAKTSGASDIAREAASTRMQSLALMGRDGSSDRQNLINKLKSLIKKKLAHFRHKKDHSDSEESSVHMGRVSIWRTQRQRSVKEREEDPNKSLELTAHHLARAIDEAETVNAESGNEEQIDSVSARLSDDSVLPHLCAHRGLAHAVLGVMEGSSLAGCERQLRDRMSEAQRRLKARVERISYSVNPDDAPASLSSQNENKDSADQKIPDASLEAAPTKREQLSSDLGRLHAGQEKLRNVLAQQQRRITALAERRRNEDSSHPEESANWAPPLPSDDDAKPLASLAPSPAAADNSWSPPVPPGLPPGYKGPLLSAGGTAVPPVGESGVP